MGAVVVESLFKFGAVADDVCFVLHSSRSPSAYYVVFLCVQRKCIEFALKAKPQRQCIPKSPIQHKVWWLVTSRGFEYFIFALIMVNTVMLAMKVRVGLTVRL